MLKDVLLFLVGILTGSMNAIAGGGMLVGFPAMLAYGLSALTANATGNIVVLPGQIASAFGYRKFLKQTPKKYLWLIVPCVLGALIGATILRHTPSSKFENYIPWLILFAVGLFAFQPFLHRYLHQHIHSKSKRVKPLFLIGLGLFPVAIYGGYFGAGIGFIMLAFLGFTKVKDAHQINAMKNVAATFMCAASILVLAHGSLINWHAGLVMGSGSLIGGYCGARFAQRISSHAIRIVVISIGVITFIWLALRYH
jgi:uncharacterized membrane protein YfcA